MAVKSRRAEHIQDTRAALLLAARELFAEKGYAGTGTEEIVARARVTRGALYHHFRDKADLFSAVMQAVASDLARQLITQQLSHPDDDAAGAWDQLRTAFRRSSMPAPAATSSASCSSTAPPCSATARGATWSSSMASGCCEPAAASRRRRPDRPPAHPPPRPAPRRSHRRSQPLHRACPDPARAHREASATIDRILSGLRPATGS